MNSLPTRRRWIRCAACTFLVLFCTVAWSGPAWAEEQTVPADEPAAESTATGEQPDETTASTPDASAADSTGSEPAAIAENETPPPAPERRNLAWVGWSVAGLGLVFAGLGIASTAIVQSAQDTIDTERDYWPGADDICAAAANGVVGPGSPNDASEIADACERGHNFTVLQYLFYSLGVVGLGLGLFVGIREVLRARRGEQDAARLSLDVALSDGGAFAVASLPF